MTGVLTRRGQQNTDTHQGKTMCRYREEVAFYVLRRGQSDHLPQASAGTSPADSLILEFPPPELRQNTSVCEMAAFSSTSALSLIVIIISSSPWLSHPLETLGCQPLKVRGALRCRERLLPGLTPSQHGPHPATDGGRKTQHLLLPQDSCDMQSQLPSEGPMGFH